ncbi:metal cation symporter ZIP8 [Synchiropus picturatus]
MCLLVSLSVFALLVTESVAGLRGHGFLQDIIQFYGQNRSISTEHLKDLLWLISERRSPSVTDDNPLAGQECPSAEEILTHFGFSNVSQLTVEHLGRICPAVLTQVLLPSCPYVPTPDPHDPADYKVWGYGFVAVTVINLAAFLGLLVIPLTKKSYFPKVLTFFIGLAIGSLFSNAVLQLIPEALGLHPEADNYAGNSASVFGGFYILFFVERVLKMLLRVDDEHCHLSPPEVQDAPHQNGDLLMIKDSVLLTSVNAISADKSNPLPESAPPNSPPPQRGRFSCCKGPDLSTIKTLAWMITLSDAVHNFIDGLAIGTSFTVSVLAGFSTSTAIICEEFPHELGDFMILLNSGLSIPQVVIFNLLSGFTCYIGLVFGILIGSNFAPNPIFGIAGGMFLYISLADMFPELDNIARGEKKMSGKIVLFLIQNAGMLTGFIIILMITLYGEQIRLE